MTQKWEWTEGGVKVGEQEFKPAAAPEEFRAYGEELEVLLYIQVSLDQALAIHSAGAADSYKGARSKIREIVVERSAARSDIAAHIVGFSNLFEPGGLHKLFEKDRDGFRSLVKETITRYTNPEPPPVTPPAPVTPDLPPIEPIDEVESTPEGAP